MKIPIAIHDDQPATKIRRSRCLHVSPGKLSIAVIYTLFQARACDGDRVDSGPCDRRLAIVSDACDAAMSPAR